MYYIWIVIHYNKRGERKGKNKSGIGGSRRILSATLEALSGKKGGYDSGRHGGQRCGPAGFGDTEKACCASDRYPIGGARWLMGSGKHQKEGTSVYLHFYFRD